MDKNRPQPTSPHYHQRIRLRRFPKLGTGEIVISYRGTDGADGFAGFDGVANAALYLGNASSQGQQAAKVYAEVLKTYGADAQGSNISFTGHSLGGGLASIMGVWFNHPAIVFDPAPFAATAQSQERVNSNGTYFVSHA